jgi:hypothetical protein
MLVRRSATGFARHYFDSPITNGNVLNIQMLANMDSSVMFHTTGLADDSTLCAKKDIIIAKFDQLLKKLGGEVNSNSSFRML